MINEELFESSNITVENRNRIIVTGVKEVGTFLPDGMMFYTVLGQLTVRGNNLKLTSLDNETGKLIVDGSITGVVYTDDRRKSGFFGRLLR